MEHSVRAWVKANGCKEEPIMVKEPKKVDDGTRVAFLGKCTKNISANDAMWEFFQKHQMK